MTMTNENYRFSLHKQKTFQLFVYEAACTCKQTKKNLDYHVRIGTETPHTTSYTYVICMSFLQIRIKKLINKVNKDKIR